MTALMVAVVSGHMEATKTLVMSNANVDARDAQENTALMYAAMAGNAEMTQLLIEHGADVNAVNREGQSVLMFAINGIDIVNKHTKPSE